MSEPFERELQTAIRAVSTAAKLCRAVQSEITPSSLEKKDRSPVTVADFGSQALICHAVHEAFPHDPIIAEEDSAALREPGNAALLKRATQHVNRHLPSVSPENICEFIDLGRSSSFSQRFWTLDPIDGTKGFLRNEQYAISLALIVDGRIEVAALGCPNLSDDPGQPGPPGLLFTAIYGHGAFVQTWDSGAVSPVAIHVSATSDPALARFCESVESGHSSHSDAASIASLLGITEPALRLDSQAKYATVARGQADLYLRLPTRADYEEKIWDHAGGALVIGEAGGRVTDISGRPLNFTCGSTLKKNNGVVASNTVLHQPLLEALNQLQLS